MRLPTRNETANQPGQPTAGDPTPTIHDSPHENETKSISGQNGDHSALVAGATNDAVRDWDVKTGRLCWRQGLSTLLGYAPAQAKDELGFWQKNLHPNDRARTAAAIRDALVGPETHWSGEYRFRRRDGSYAQLLERALIVRDGSGAAIRFI